jgi:hypothetical protein
MDRRPAGWGRPFSGTVTAGTGLMNSTPRGQTTPHRSPRIPGPGVSPGGPLVTGEMLHECAPPVAWPESRRGDLREVGRTAAVGVPAKYSAVQTRVTSSERRPRASKTASARSAPGGRLSLTDQVVGAERRPGPQQVGDAGRQVRGEGRPARLVVHDGRRDARLASDVMVRTKLSPSSTTHEVRITSCRSVVAVSRSPSA